MRIHASIDGKEVTNPFAKGVFAVCGIAIAGLMIACVIFFVLPLVGITLGLVAGVLAIIATLLLLTVPVLLLFGKKTVIKGNNES